MADWVLPPVSPWFGFAQISLSPSVSREIAFYGNLN
jgi:hypothetical protein